MTKLFVFALATIGWFSVEYHDVLNVPRTEFSAASSEQDARQKHTKVIAVKRVPVEFRISKGFHWYVESNGRGSVWSNNKRDAKVMHSFSKLTQELETIYRSSADSDRIYIDKTVPVLRANPNEYESAI